MFDTLSDKMTDAFRRLSGQGRITDSNIRDTMADVRIALLDADVSLEIAESFCDDVQAEAMGEEVLRSLRPGR